MKNIYTLAIIIGTTSIIALELKTIDDVKELIEHAQIDAWLEANKKTLNQYGDPITTSAISYNSRQNPFIAQQGGFIKIQDPKTKQYRPMTIYEYIQARHPKSPKPWETELTITEPVVRAQDKTQCMQVCTVKK